MDKKEVIRILQIERECISRNCDRNCGYCDLVQEQETLLEAYNYAISILQNGIILCDDCMYDAPHGYCCKLECGDHDFCDGCSVESRGESCPRE